MDLNYIIFNMLSPNSVWWLSFVGRQKGTMSYKVTLDRESEGELFLPV